MKCQNCGAEIGKGQFCQYCGSRISYDMRREQEQLNKTGCPICGSSNITFRREKEGEITKRYKNSSVNQSVFATTGMCKDCGYTWQTAQDTIDNSTGKNNTVWWVLGWIFLFPVPVMILIWRKKNTWSTKVKIIVTVVFWILFLIIYMGSDKSDRNGANSSYQAANKGQADIVELDLTRNDDFEIKAGQSFAPGWVNAGD